MSYLGTKPQIATEIADGVVVTADIADNAITTAKIAVGAVVTADLADNAVTPIKLAQPLTSGTSVSSTSGTSIDFTGIPSWVRRITLTLNGVSANGIGRHIIQLGTGGVPTTSGYTVGYLWISTNNSTVRAINSATTGFALFADEAADSSTGSFVFTLQTGNTWICNGGNVTFGTNAGSGSTFGSIGLSGTLNMVRVTTSTGTATFDQGTINILYE